MNARLLYALLAFHVAGIATPNVWSQNPNPQSPQINMLFPGGMRRGTAQEFTIAGTNLNDATQVLGDMPAKLSIVPTKTKAANSVRVKIDVPAQASVGLYPIYVATKNGVSNPRLFCIDDLPQIEDNAKNKTKDAPQIISTPCVVAGRMDSQTSDYYRFSAKKGQRFNFEILSRRLGGAADPLLTVYDAVTLAELDGVNDSPGCQADARFSFVAPRDGAYVIGVRDLLYRGGADYVYRLRIGDFPLITAAVPMAVQRGTKTALEFCGPFAKFAKPLTIAVSKDEIRQTIAINAAAKSGTQSLPVELAISDHPEAVEKEPNNDLTSANPVSVPSGVTGRFLQPNDADWYQFTAKKGQRIRIQGHTLQYHSPTVVYLRLVQSSSKKTLAESKPTAAPFADQRIDFTAPADGKYIVEVQHLNFEGGPEQVYRITIEPIDADFELALAVSQFDVIRGSLVPIKVQAIRSNYSGPIELQLQGESSLTSLGSIRAGQDSGLLLVRCPKDAAFQTGLMRITGSAKINGKTVHRIAGTNAAMTKSLAGLPFPMHSMTNRVPISVSARGPFQLVAKLNVEKRYRGSTVRLNVSATRDKGFATAIALTDIAGLPSNIKLPKKLPAIAKGKNDVSIALAVDAKTPLGSFPIVATGQAKVGTTNFAVPSTATELVVQAPFAFAAPPKTGEWKKGGKYKVNVKIKRQAGYTGPITLQLRKLPANVSAKKITLPAGKSDATIEINVAANATVGAKKDVDILGVATAAANQQVASPAFAIEITK